jgi:hypothetical protein
VLASLIETRAICDPIRGMPRPTAVDTRVKLYCKEFMPPSMSPIPEAGPPASW